MEAMQRPVFHVNDALVSSSGRVGSHGRSGRHRGGTRCDALLHLDVDATRSGRIRLPPPRARRDPAAARLRSASVSLFVARTRR
eukprot:31112-Pelagococcus_subviridis.AAC.5